MEKMKNIKLIYGYFNKKLIIYVDEATFFFIDSKNHCGNDT